MGTDANDSRIEPARLDEDDATEWLRCARAGDYAAAWRCSDRILARGRLRDTTAARHVQQIWDGCRLDGRRVLIRCYHGLGDTVQFIRYAPLVRTRARHVVLWVQPSLMALLDGIAGIDRLLPLHEGVPEVSYDVDVELMELPHVFRSTLATLPSSIPYLSAPRAALPEPSPRIGIAWRAGGWDARRSVPFAQVTRLIESLPHLSWFALQHEPDPAEQHTRLCALDTHGISRTASLMQALDLVISIDSLPAHLAGALGRPVWTLLTEPADWRWLEGRADTPWYPTMRLFRQSRPGTWDGAIDLVRRALADRFGTAWRERRDLASP